MAKIRGIEDKFEQALIHSRDWNLLKLVNRAIQKSTFPSELRKSKHFVEDLRYLLKGCAVLADHYSKYPEGRDEAIEGMRRIYNFSKVYGTGD